MTKDTNTNYIEEIFHFIWAYGSHIGELCFERKLECLDKISLCQTYIMKLLNKKLWNLFWNDAIWIVVVDDKNTKYPI